MLVHSVFFWLRSDLTSAERLKFDTLLDALKGVKSAEKVYIGTPAATGDRPVVDSTYTVALTVLFKDMAAHDAYQVDPLHQMFLTCKASWTRVQIYDAA